MPKGTELMVEAREVLHRVANHVLARAQFGAIGRLGLRPTPGGFGTLAFGDRSERLRVSGGLLVHESRDGDRTATRVIEIAGSSLAQLAAFAGVDLAAEFSAGHDTPPVGDADEALRLDVAEAGALAEWYTIIAEALDRLIGGVPGASTPTTAQLWPEHFDLALDAAYDPSAPDERRVNLGGSPGDDSHPAPYLYVGPWTDDRPGAGEFWNAPFGALLDREVIVASPRPVDAAVEFFRTGIALLGG